MSIIPLINGTPGTKNNGLVAKQISAVQSKLSAAEAQSDAMNADNMNMTKWFTL